MSDGWWPIPEALVPESRSRDLNAEFPSCSLCDRRWKGAVVQEKCPWFAYCRPKQAACGRSLLAYLSRRAILKAI